MTTEGLNHLNKVIDEVRKGVLNADTVLINLVTALSNKIVQLEKVLQENITSNMLDEVIGIDSGVTEEPLIDPSLIE